MISILLSLVNFRFNKRFEAVKKRTELLMTLLQTMSVMKSKREQLLLVKDICKKCPASRSDKVCSDYDKTIERLETTYKKYDRLLSVADPIRLEYELADFKKLYHKTKTFVDGIDIFLEKIKECERRTIR